MSTKIFKEKIHMEGGEVIRNVILGMNDGIVSIFALLAGIAGAGLSAVTILITLVAATIAGALSMGVGDYISSKSERDYFQKEINQERSEIKLVPDAEKEELRFIYQNKGLEGPVLDQIIDTIVKDPELWAKEMVNDELGIANLEIANVGKAAFVTFGAFFIGAFFPTGPYLLMIAIPQAEVIFWTATILTVGGLFLVGSLKKFITGVYWLKSGLEMLVAGTFAFGVSYLIGLAIGVSV